MPMQTTPSSIRLVIVGAGMAATRLVQELTTRDDKRYTITVIGDEPHAAYNRVLLSSVLAGDITAKDITLENDDWWTEKRVARIHGSAVTAIDTARQTLTLQDGRSLPYDQLVIATGSEAIRLPLPGASTPGVMTFRTLDDTHRLLAEAHAKRRAIVIGGGLLGLEAAYGLAKAGAQVTVVHVMDRLMERQLDDTAASMLQDELVRRNITVHLAAQSAAILGSDCVEGLVLKTGNILPADLIVMAVGVRPATQLARNARLAVNRGILVDDGLATSDPHIFAIGECAEHLGQCYGLVEPAYDQARILAQRLMGVDSTYRGSLTATNLKVSGVHVFSAGDHIGRAGTESLILRDRGSSIYKKLVLSRTDRGTILEGCVLYGNTVDGLWYLDLMRKHVPIDQFRSELIFGRSHVNALAA